MVASLVVARGGPKTLNCGLPTDYAQLDSMGISVAGRIAIARYGRSFRGIKAREAEQIKRLELLSQEADLDPHFAKKFLTFVIDEVIQHHKKHQQ